MMFVVNFPKCYELRDKQLNPFTHLMHKHPRTLVVHILVDTVPTVDECIRSPSTVYVASLNRIHNVIIRSRQAITKQLLDFGCDSVTDVITTLVCQLNVNSHFDDTCSHLVGIVRVAVFC